MLFVVERPNASGLARIVNGGIETQWFEGVQFRSLDHRNGVVVALTEQMGSGAVDVARVQNGNLTPLTSDGLWKGGVAVSPDATYYAYTVRTRPPTLDEQGEEVYNVDDYRTEVRSFDGTYAQSFPGNHPHFLSEVAILLFTPEGLVSQSLQGLSRTVREDDLVFLAEERPHFGNNATLVVRNPISQELMVFEFISTELLAYQLIGSLPIAEKDFGLSKEKTVYQGTIREGMFLFTEFSDLEKQGTVVFSVSAKYFAPQIGFF